MRIMKSKASPIRSTIVWGLIGGLVYIPLCSLLGMMVFWPLGIELAVAWIRQLLIGDIATHIQDGIYTFWNYR